MPPALSPISRSTEQVPSGSRLTLYQSMSPPPKSPHCFSGTSIRASDTSEHLRYTFHSFMHFIIEELGWLHRTDTYFTVYVRGLALSALDIYTLILGTSERACVSHFTLSVFLFMSLLCFRVSELLYVCTTDSLSLSPSIILSPPEFILVHFTKSSFPTWISRC